MEKVTDNSKIRRIIDIILNSKLPLSVAQLSCGTYTYNNFHIRPGEFVASYDCKLYCNKTTMLRKIIWYIIHMEWGDIDGEDYTNRRARESSISDRNWIRRAI